MEVNEMSAILKDAIESLKILQSKSKFKNKKIADELLGKYRGIIPKGKNSTQFIKNLRKGLHGKIK
jgi:hypothetical protein